MLALLWLRGLSMSLWTNELKGLEWLSRYQSATYISILSNADEKHLQIKMFEFCPISQSNQTIWFNPEKQTKTLHKTAKDIEKHKIAWCQLTLCEVWFFRFFSHSTGMTRGSSLRPRAGVKLPFCCLTWRDTQPTWRNIPIHCWWGF